MKPVTPRALSPLPHATVADAATSALFEAIVDGTIAPATHLRLQDLAEQFGFSMMPMREAVRELAHLGLVDMEPHRGAFVRAMTLEDVTSTYTTRFLLEGEAAAAAARGFTSEQAGYAREALAGRARYLAMGDTRRARDAHERFHFTIYEAAANPWLVRSIMPVWRNAERYRLESMRHPELAERRACEHEEILAAVVAGDSDRARERMVAHLRTSLDLILSTFEADTHPRGRSDVSSDVLKHERAL